MPFLYYSVHTNASIPLWTVRKNRFLNVLCWDLLEVPEGDALFNWEYEYMKPLESKKKKKKLVLCMEKLLLSHSS